MTKLFLSVLLLLLLFNGFSQNDSISIESGTFKLKKLDNCTIEAFKIIEIKGKSSDEIYGLVLNWVAYTFVNSESVIQSQIENRMIRIHGVSNSVIDGFLSYNYGLDYFIQVDIKDERLRLRAYDINIIGADNARTRTEIEGSVLNKKCEERSHEMSKQIINQTNIELNNIYESLVAIIENGAYDDW